MKKYVWFAKFIEKKLQQKYLSHHASIDPIPILTLVSILLIFGSIRPPLATRERRAFLLQLTFAQNYHNLPVWRSSSNTSVCICMFMTLESTAPRLSSAFYFYISLLFVQLCECSLWHFPKITLWNAVLKVCVFSITWPHLHLPAASSEFQPFASLHLHTFLPSSCFCSVICLPSCENTLSHLTN